MLQGNPKARELLWVPPNHPEGAGNIPEGGNGVLGILWRSGHCQENPRMVQQLCAGWPANSQGNRGCSGWEEPSHSSPKIREFQHLGVGRGDPAPPRCHPVGVSSPRFPVPFSKLRFKAFPKPWEWFSHKTDLKWDQALDPDIPGWSRSPGFPGFRAGTVPNAAGISRERRTSRE